MIGETGLRYHSTEPSLLDEAGPTYLVRGGGGGVVVFEKN